MKQMEAWWDDAAKQQSALGQPVTADKNWLVVTPDQLH
jgi:hypothetical protein